MQTPDPLVSVIITTYNRKHLLKKAVSSVLAQTYPAIEIIIVDDGSVDGTGEFVAGYTQPNVRYIRQDNQGVAGARNTGILAAQGKYINFLEDDDTLYPTKIERQVKILKDHPELGLVHCGWDWTDLDGNKIERSPRLPEKDWLENLVIGCYLLMHTPLTCKECFDKVGLFSKELVYTADWDMWLRIARAGFRFGVIQECLCAYVIHPSSMTEKVQLLEKAALGTLKSNFDDPRLPPHIVAMEEAAYNSVNSWLVGRYFSAGYFEEGAQKLRAWLSKQPEIAQDPKSLIRRISEYALDFRNQDPLEFCNRLFEHLPDELAFIRDYAPMTKARVCTMLALRTFAAKNLEEACRLLAQAENSSPTYRDEEGDFVTLLSSYALVLEVSDPIQYAKQVLNHLPTSLAHFSKQKKTILSNISAARAFAAYEDGMKQRVIQSVLFSLWYDLSWIKNRGMASIFIRSLFPFLQRNIS
jgi:glycosyltransferase involved in cell wall biosynthesis